jgi:hypothetical protein
MGEQYDTRVYYNLISRYQVAVPNDLFDLALETGQEGMRIWLNEGKLMAAINTGHFRFDSAYAAPNPSSSQWSIDATSGHPDSTAFGNWWGNLGPNGQSTVFLVNRGSLYHSSPADQFFKLQITQTTANAYILRVAPAGDTGTPAPIAVPKLAQGYSRVFFTFTDGGKVVQVAPPDADWHLLFTRYTAILDNSGTAIRYSVTGVLANRALGIGVAKAGTFAQRQDAAWDDLNAQWLINHPQEFASQADAIGHSWKYYDFDHGYQTRQGWHYLVSIPGLAKPTVFKLRFLDFYDPQGRKGTPTFQHQRIL